MQGEATVSDSTEASDEVVADMAGWGFDMAHMMPSSTLPRNACFYCTLRNSHFLFVIFVSNPAENILSSLSNTPRGHAP